jgi:hypothetical protein
MNATSIEHGLLVAAPFSQGLGRHEAKEPTA